MIGLQKLKKGDKVAVISPSFGAPGVWPHVYHLGLERLKNNFGLYPVAFPTTTEISASTEARARDLVAAFRDPSIKAVIASIGGDDQVTYIKNLPPNVFVENPKPFFGFSDNTHFANFLWLNNVPSYYGGALFTQFAMQGEMDEYTTRYLQFALFEGGMQEILPSKEFNEIGFNWNDKSSLMKRRSYETNDGFFWDGISSTEGITWGGCLESIDDMLRHNNRIPSLEQFEKIILMTETSEEIPAHDYVLRVYRALGERGILKRVKGIIVGRPKSWEFDKQSSSDERKTYRNKQRETILNTVRKYNKEVPVIQNLDFGHTDPQIPVPYGSLVKIDMENKRIFAQF